jgi:hypothetical protein
MKQNFSATLSWDKTGIKNLKTMNIFRPKTKHYLDFFYISTKKNLNSAPRRFKIILDDPTIARMDTLIK